MIEGTKSRFPFGSLAIDAMIEEHPAVEAAKARLVAVIDQDTEKLKMINRGLRAELALKVLGEFGRKITGQE